MTVEAACSGTRGGNHREFCSKQAFCHQNITLFNIVVWMLPADQHLIVPAMKSCSSPVLTKDTAWWLLVSTVLDG